MNKYLKNNWKFVLAFIIILSAGIYLRLFNAKYLFAYSHDNDLAGWVIRDIVYNHHYRLIGQETSTAGVFIGSLYYYLQIPFYALSGMDPIGVVLLGALTGVFGMLSIFYVFGKIWNRETGLVGMLIYAISLEVAFTERGIVPTAPVFLWTIWLLYALYAVLKGEQKRGFILAGILGGLIWQMNVALVVPFSLVLVSYFISRKKLEFRNLLLGLSAFFVANVPLLLFELRHNFSQLRAILGSLSQDQKDILTGVEKLKRVIYLMSKDISNVIFGGTIDFKVEWVFLGLLILFAILIYKKIMSKKLAVIFSLWILLYITFFSLYSKIVSEYYLHGAMIVVIAIVSVAVGQLIRNTQYSLYGLILISLFCSFNYQHLIDYPINRSGYQDRKDIITYIESDSKNKSYPCVSISYITDPGYERGYRYFVWLRNLKLKPITGRVPVYSVVFPLSKVDKVDKTYGAIGIVYPDYKRYEGVDLTKECEGEDFNLVDSMIGFTP